MEPVEVSVIVTLLAIALVVLVLAFVGNLPHPDRFLAVNELPDTPAARVRVAEVLTRTRRTQRIGAISGFALGGTLGLGTSAGFGVAGAAVGLLAGTLLGMAAAEPFADAEPRGDRHAALVPRNTVAYLPRHSVVPIALLVVAILTTVGVGIGAAPNGLGVTFVLFAFALGTIAAVPLARRAQRRTLEARRSDLDPAAVRVDDALRACAVRAIHHATVGVLLCGLLLSAYGLVATQNATDVVVDRRVAVHLPPLADDIRLVPLPPAPARPQRWRITWTPVANGRETRVIRGTMVRLDGIGLDLMTSLGIYATWLGLAGALYQFGRAAKAWRRPQRSPSAVAATTRARGATA